MDDWSFHSALGSDSLFKRTTSSNVFGKPARKCHRKKG